MNLQTGSFDTVAAIRHLAGQVAQLERRLAALETVAPSATMDAAEHGATLGAPRPAGETAGERGDPPRKRRAGKGGEPPAGDAVNGSAHLQASGGVRTGPGALVALLLTAGGDAAAVTVYDNTAGAGTVLAVLTAAAGTTAPAWVPPGGQACAHGLYAEITGTAPDVIVVYR